MQEDGMLRKLFLGTLASCVVGNPTNVKLQGTKEEIDCIVRMILAAREFHDLISSDSDDLQTVLKALDEKMKIADEFQNMFGMRFSL